MKSRVPHRGGVGPTSSAGVHSRFPGGAMQALCWVSLAVAALGRTRAVTMEAVEVFSGDNCAGSPDVLAMYNESANCAEDACSDISFGNDTYYISRTCNVSDRFAHTKAVFGEFTYVMMETYDNQSCASFGEADVFLASGSCEISSGLGDQSVITSLYSNGSAVVALYPNDACGGEPSLYFELDKAALSTGSCQQGLYKFYSSAAESSSSLSSSGADGSSSSLAAASPQSSGSSSSAAANTVSSGSSGSGISTGAVVGIAAAALVLVVVVALYIARRFRKKCGAQQEEEEGFSSFQSPSGGPKKGSSTAPGTTNSLGDDGSGSVKPASLVGLWDDEVIATARVPREKVIIQRSISRGGGGEVYVGLFNQQQVAIKMLLPELRKSVKHVNAFLAEVKLMATLEHPRIVQFVGVAWDSLTDLCVVSEFMEGGDLRALLNSYETHGHELGFDRSKVTIALHVAHALTYLHSLESPVLHRDLKSKNVLLTSALDAKLTDFGISRERADKTMTAGVGTSRWMAPEVMLGKKYDDKADMFSFGVMLSELDVHVLPYSHAKDCGEIDSDHKISEAVIMQMVALGKLRVEFSSDSLVSMVLLGLACVSLDPAERPTAAEALYRLHTILSQEL